MKIVLAFCFSIASFLLSAQVITGRVLDAENGQIVPFAGITINENRRGITADATGEFELPKGEPVTHIYVRAFGYDKQRVDLAPGQTRITVLLSSQTSELNEVKVLAGENPLHRIIRNVIKHRDENNPTQLNSFTYDTYSKVLFTIAMDSSMPDFDTTFAPIDTLNPESGWENEKVDEIDSTGFFVRQFMSQQHVFMMESVTKRSFARPRDHERVLATRISGLSTPMFVLLAGQMQSFSIYEDYINILGSERVSPIAPGAIGRYAYIPKDTLIQGQDTTYVIVYFPVKGHRFKGVDGEMYIHAGDWAVTEIIARPTHQDILGIEMDSSAVFGVEIQQTLDRIDGHWFPREMLMSFRQFSMDEFGSSQVFESADAINLVGFGRTVMKNIQINPEINSTDVERIAVSVDDDATEKDDAFWYQYRGDSLDAREQRTYEYNDSVFQAEGIEEQLQWLVAFSTGKIRWGLFDIDLDKIVRYSSYEGFRLGAGLQTNHRVSKYYSLGGHVGYGFKDKVFKFGYFGEVYLNKIREATLYGGYSFDIQELGGTNFSLQRKTILGNADYRFLTIYNFDEVSDVFGGFRYRIWPNLKTDVSLHRQNRFASGGYYYHYSEGQQDVLVNGFNALIARLELEYAPNDKYISGPFGLRKLETTYPIFRFSYEHSFDGVFNQNYAFNKVNMEAVHQIKKVYLGTTTFTLNGSYVDADVPYSFLSTPQANGTGNLSKNIISSSVGSLRSFETMVFNRFATDVYVTFDLRHSFEDRLFKIGTWAPSIDVLFRTGWGSLAHPELHYGMNLQGMEHGYHEAGLEINNIYSGLGLGFYQRFGAYYSGEYANNLAIKLTYLTTLF